MPIYERSGGAWVAGTPRHRQNGAWSDEEAAWYIRNGGSWDQFHPDPATATLDPPESVAMSSVDNDAGTLGWTNPTQAVTPTHIQVRLAELGAVWVEIDYPDTSYTWSALTGASSYVAQVRYIVRTAGVITATSPTKHVEFTTDADPIGAPAEDPGGTGGDTIVPFSGSTGNPTAPSTTDGSWWEWKLELLSQTALSWSSPNPPNTQLSDDGSTQIAGEVAGNASQVSWNDGDLTAGRIYRVCRREVTDNTSDGVADVFGAWVCGAPFAAPTDWDAACGGFSGSTGITGLTAEDDAVWRFPQFCLNADGEMVMREAVTGLEILKGPGFFSFFTDGDGEEGVTPLTTMTTAPFYPTMAAVLPQTIVQGSDWSQVHRFKALPAFSGVNGRTYTLFSGGGGAYAINVTESVTGWTFETKILGAGGGFVTLTSSELAYDNETHTIAVTWDADGTKTLYLDGTSEDTDTGTDVYETLTSFSGVTSTPAYIVPLQQLGWNRVLTSTEIESFSAPPGQITAMWRDQTDGTSKSFTVEVGDLLIWAAERNSAAAPTLDFAGSTATYVVDQQFTNYWKTTGYDGHSGLAVYRITSVAGGTGITVANSSPDQSNVVVLVRGGLLYQQHATDAMHPQDGTTGVKATSLVSAPSGRVLAFVTNIGYRSGGYVAADDTFVEQVPWVDEGHGYHDNSGSFSQVHFLSSESRPQTIDGAFNNLYQVGELILTTSNGHSVWIVELA